MSAPDPPVLGALAAATIQLLRLSLDLIATASNRIGDLSEAPDVILNMKKPVVKQPQRQFFEHSYGSVATTDEEETAAKAPPPLTNAQRIVPLLSFGLHSLATLALAAFGVLATTDGMTQLFWTCSITFLLGAVLAYRDMARVRFSYAQRLFYVLTAMTILYSMLRLEPNGTVPSILATLYLLFALAECYILNYSVASLDGDNDNNNNNRKRPQLSHKAYLTLLKPYFWPDATDSTAFANRFRAIITWICVILSKVANLYSPILLGWASTALARHDYVKCIEYSILYSILGFVGSTLKEGQSVVYLKVAQAAFVQLSETAFSHLHSLSLDFHLRKKLGETIRNMDRGIAACDTLMKYLFLWLIPALAECLVLVVIFATYFNYWPLAVNIFYFVFVYIVWTILVTLWRKKFRKEVVASDNEWRDRCTDSLINFETVKFFTAETYEMKRFGEAVQRYQTGSVSVQASLSFLNISQRLLLQACLATSLSMAALGIKQRWDCCEANGCDDGNSQCCTDLKSMCPGMDVGDFVAVLSYTIQLFTPLNFLGSVYNAIVMAVIDLTNLSELLAESPDVVDAKDAITLPSHNSTDPDIAVEFDNVMFHYPTQSENMGLKGLSFKMKRGTTTAIVGPTGAGKTTVSRLLFRFYDVLGGAVKINGVDVRALTQKSLRGAIGAVPQTASMFNDTLRANILYGRRDASQEELERAAADAQLTTFIASLEEGWDTMVGDRGLKLSGGERQRAAIARCLLKNPPFVILDEATSALDSITENSVQDALDSLGSERTVLVIAHRLGTIRNADNIVVIKEGMVDEQGTHDELMAKNGSYAELWNMQLHSTDGGSRTNLAQLDGAE